MRASPSLTQGQNAIEELRRDHDFFMHELSRSIKTMRGLLSNAERQEVGEELDKVRARIAAVEQRLSAHNSMEENYVYLWTVTVLNHEEQSALAARVEMELDRMPPRFSANEKDR